MHRIPPTLLPLALFLSATAAEAPPPPPLPAAVPPAAAPASPPAAEEEEPPSIPEPEVTIIRRKDAVIEEYRVNGRLRYAKITPAKGPPYYLFDSDGDGVLDTRYDDLENPPINQWILMRW